MVGREASVSEEWNTRVLGPAYPTPIAAYGKFERGHFATQPIRAKIQQCRSNAEVKFTASEAQRRAVAS